MNLLCLVLCLTNSIVRYIAAEPPKTAVPNRVFSAIRRLCFFARDLSDTVIIIAATLIIARYIRKYFIDIPLFQTNKPADDMFSIVLYPFKQTKLYALVKFVKSGLIAAVPEHFQRSFIVGPHKFRVLLGQ